MKIREYTINQESFYHIFNRGINSEKVFIKDSNYIYFLKKVREYLCPCFEIYCYCLMPNHFHFILKAKKEIALESTKLLFREKGLHSKNSIFSKNIGKLISSYTQGFNKVNGRSGAIFESPFKRIPIDSEEYLKNLIIYIHQNPLDFENYKYSSYQSIISEKFTLLEREKVIEYFGDIENFKYCHKNKVII